MPIRMVVTDMDETLLTTSKEISPRTRRAIAAASARGVSVCLASGRLPAGMRRYHASLGLQTPLVGGNGAIIEMPDGQILREAALCGAILDDVLTMVDELDLYAQVYVGDLFFYNKPLPYAEHYSRVLGMAGEFAPNLRVPLKGGGTGKVLVMAEPAHVTTLIGECRERFSGRLTATSSRPTFLELTAPDATKGQAAACLATLLNVPQCETMACGDALNDISMIAWAGLGVAMANAADAVKSAADCVTAANDADGLAIAIERYVLAE